MKTTSHKKTAVSVRLHLLLIAGLLFTLMPWLQAQKSLTYPVVDTGQETFYDTAHEIPEPAPGAAYYGQDAQYTGNVPSYQDNGDGTVTDLVTGLMWQQSTDLNGDGMINYEDKLSYDEALAAADTFSLGGYSDWRLPSIKEMYSLFLMTGIDPSGYTGTSTAGLVPFIDTNYFDFNYGDLSSGERLIDAQYASSTIYVSPNGMGGQELMFGVNFADGRIKGYPTGPNPGQTEPKQFYVQYVRGNSTYGINDFQDNGNGTITDNATGLMWTQDDDGSGMNWETALEYAEEAVVAGYDDWRLPNVKELQSILDYSRAPAVTGSAAIDPVFECTSIIDEGGNPNYPFFWSSSTHVGMQPDAPGGWGAYVAFGEALGWMEQPPMSGNYTLMDVHGAGAQRSDPKQGDPANWPHGHGPQGDVIRIYNFVRLVRDAGVSATNDQSTLKSSDIKIHPNPAIKNITVDIGNVNLKNAIWQIFNPVGKSVYTQTYGGNQNPMIDVENLEPGLYVLVVNTSSMIYSGKFIKH